MERKWIHPLDGDGRKKEYLITDEGKGIVDREIQRLEELYSNGQKITKGGNEHEEGKISL